MIALETQRSGLLFCEWLFVCDPRAVLGLQLLAHFFHFFEDA
jgi:hypothetical protein